LEKDLQEVDCDEKEKVGPIVGGVVGGKGVEPCQRTGHEAQQRRKSGGSLPRRRKMFPGSERESTVWGQRVYRRAPETPLEVGICSTGFHTEDGIMTKITIVLNASGQGRRRTKQHH